MRSQFVVALLGLALLGSADAAHRSPLRRRLFGSGQGNPCYYVRSALEFYRCHQATADAAAVAQAAADATASAKAAKAEAHAKAVAEAQAKAVERAGKEAHAKAVERGQKEAAAKAEAHAKAVAEAHAKAVERAIKEAAAKAEAHAKAVERAQKEAHAKYVASVEAARVGCGAGNFYTAPFACTPCSAGFHTSAASQTSCKQCEVNDALDATHVGFAVAKGAKKCDKHTVCTLPTTLNGAGEYETKPARPHHDRECGTLVVAAAYQFISQTETATSPRIVESCPFNYKATDDFSGCYAYRCSHVTCSHLKHKCSMFNTVAQHRTPGTMAALMSHRNECDGTTLFKTTVTLHNRDENTCNNGHWCGMGVVTGDKTKCECAPLNLKPAKVDKGKVNTQGDVGLATYKAASAGFALGGAGYAFAGDYGTKGLYYYTSGTYKNMAFFGTGGTMAQESAPVSPPKARISTSEASYDAALVSHMQDTYAATP